MTGGNVTSFFFQRGTMFLLPDWGGIGLVNIRLKIMALHLVQTAKIVSNQSCKWTLFGHTSLGLTLVKFKDYVFF